MASSKCFQSSRVSRPQMHVHANFYAQPACKCSYITEKKRIQILYGNWSPKKCENDQLNHSMSSVQVRRKLNNKKKVMLISRVRVPLQDKLYLLPIRRALKLKVIVIFIIDYLSMVDKAPIFLLCQLVNTIYIYI